MPAAQIFRSMEKEISKTQIDRLGEHLKKDSSTEADLRLLEQYRQSFDNAYEIVRKAIREQLSLETTGRRKTTQSIVDKLRRESIRLTQIQDIAGCRLLVEDITNQNEVVTSLCNLFEDVIIVDRREKPSHGYRAVHVIVRYREKFTEIQVRTVLQHLWAELSEKYSDVVDQAIKYGGGNEEIQEYLKLATTVITRQESFELELITMKQSLQSMENDQRFIAKITNLEEALLSDRQILFKTLDSSINHVRNLKRRL